MFIDRWYLYILVQENLIVLIWVQFLMIIDWFTEIVVTILEGKLMTNA